MSQKGLHTSMRKFGPSEVIITFDLHGVLFTTDYRQFLSILWYSPHVMTLIIHAVRPILWYTCFRLWRQSSPIEQYIMELTTLWPHLAPCRTTLIVLANAQKPNQGMIALVQKLKQEGYELHIFSNIGTIILADLRTKFPEILALFDHTFTTSAAIGYLSKRQSDFFKSYLKSCVALNGRHVIFIDDCHKNNSMGNTHGMIAIIAKDHAWVHEQLKSYIQL